MNCNLQKDNSDNSVVVYVKTNYYSDKNEVLHANKTIRVLRRKSPRFNFFDEDIANMGAEGFAQSIVNLWTVEDGYYRMIIVNEHRDYESGVIDDYEFKLVPYKQ